MEIVNWYCENVEIINCFVFLLGVYRCRMPGMYGNFFPFSTFYTLLDTVVEQRERLPLLPNNFRFKELLQCCIKSGS